MVGLPSVFVNNILLEHSRAHYLHVVCGCFLAAVAASSRTGKAHMAHKAPNIYYLPFYRKSLLTLSLAGYKIILIGCNRYLKKQNRKENIKAHCMCISAALLNLLICKHICLYIYMHTHICIYLYILGKNISLSVSSSQKSLKKPKR